MANSVSTVDVAIVGAGPCGLATAIAAKRAGMTSLLFDRGSLVAGLASYPAYMNFFSTAERLSIGDIPFVVPTEKPNRREALAYYRAVATHYDVDVRQYETVTSIERLSHDDVNFGIDDVDVTCRMPRWRVNSRRRSGVECTTYAHAVVVATGYFGRPNRLGGVPGETLPHVFYRYTEGHGAWREPVVVVGGANSAVDAALDLYRAGARVTLVHFGPELDANVKPWVRPDIVARIAEGSIHARYNARVIAIEPETVVIHDPTGEHRIPATQVYTMTGYLAETGLLESAGVPLDAVTGIPAHDRVTMATPVPGLYIAGVIASGFDANKIFIENGRDHGRHIVADILATTPSPELP